MYQLQDALVDEFMLHKDQYDVVSQAVKIAKNDLKNDQLFEELLCCKDKAKEEYMNLCAKVLKAMQGKGGLVSLRDGWYAIRYKGSKNENALVATMLIDRDAYLLDRSETEKPLRKAELDSLIPGVENVPMLEYYKTYLVNKASEYLRDNYITPIQTKEVEQVSEPVVTQVHTKPSAHAGKRWVQRMVGIQSESQAEVYRLAHLDEVNTAVMESFSRSLPIWSEQDGIEYRFDSSNNVMFVVGEGNVITLYEEDFGFSKDINRMIVGEQVRVLYGMHKELKESEQRHNDICLFVGVEVQGIDSQIDVLEASLASLRSEKQMRIAQREESANRHRLAQSKFTAEFNKLFKKWEG